MTVYKYLREGPPQRKRHTVHGQRRVIDPWEPYLLGRWGEGCRMATRLWREIRAPGFAHSVSNVHRFAAQVRREGPPPAGRPRTALTKPEGPPPRPVAGIVLRRPERRTDEERAYLDELRTQDPAVATAVDLAADVLVMVRRREGERLPAWQEQAEASGVDELKRFAGKLRADQGTPCGPGCRSGGATGSRRGTSPAASWSSARATGAPTSISCAGACSGRPDRSAPGAATTDPIPPSPEARESRRP
jgi:hypothetical protein